MRETNFQRNKEDFEKRMWMHKTTPAPPIVMSPTETNTTAYDTYIRTGKMLEQEKLLLDAEEKEIAHMKTLDAVEKNQRAKAYDEKIIAAAERMKANNINTFITTLGLTVDQAEAVIYYILHEMRDIDLKRVEYLKSLVNCKPNSERLFEARVRVYQHKIYTKNTLLALQKLNAYAAKNGIRVEDAMKVLSEKVK
jgi:hypothetical protein